MSTTHSSEDLLTDLLYLRKNEGASATRLAKAGAVDRALGDGNDDAEVKLERLRSAIHSLDDDQAAVLMAAFALSPETNGIKSLKERRKLYGTQVGRKVDTIAARENVALEQLRFQLLTGWYPASPLPRRVPELHNGVVNELVELTTVVSDGCWMESRHHYRMLALFDEADYYEISTSYAMTVTTYGGWTSTTDESPGGYTVRFYPPHPMRRGEIYDLHFKFSPPPGDPDELSLPGQICEESLAFHERTLEARFEVVFLGEKPELVYYFTGMTSLQRPEAPTPERVLEIGQKRSVRMDFQNLCGGLFSGFAWLWVNI
ncbi:hypothetical protein [Corynebacterium variabile]|uniref:hypothetical protein n=1 Tax=Corynebacterium variabile TaxID=1727 RepID=UPI003A9590BB